MTGRMICGALMLSLAASPILAAMDQLPQCQLRGGALDLVHLDVFDLGQGMTTHLENSAATGSHLIVTSCHTGNYLRATVWDGPEHKRKEFPEALTILEDRTGPDAVVYIGQLAEALEAAAVPTTYGVNRSETCACAARYPGLRGTKQPFAP